MHVYVDESARHSYLLGAAVVFGSLLQRRRSLRALCRPGQRRIHFSQESDQRRKAILSAIETLDVGVRIYRCDSTSRDPRTACLRGLLGDLIPAGARRLVIESRDGQDHGDDEIIRAALREHGTGRLVFGHATPYEEPLLWVPDAVAWAVGRGGDWRRRCAAVLEKVVDVEP
jgi:hypothetical protein